MNINELKDSRYLRKEDCTPNGLLVTIASGQMENVAMEGKPPEMLFVLHFAECEKGLIVKSTNAQLLAAALGSDETDDWVGKRVVLYNDPSITFQGKLVGGIRVRAPRGPASNPKPVAKPTPEPADPGPEEDVPY